VCKNSEIIFHFNKKHLEDPNIPMWVIKCKGETHYVHHVNVDKGVGFSTKETPDNPSTFYKFVIFINKNIMNKKKTNKDFISDAIKVHGDRYDYNMVEYKNNQEKVVIKCHLHGEFTVRPNDHISKKSGCPLCAGKNKTTNDFIKSANKVHGDSYDYSKTIYNGVDRNVIITCAIHGDFEQTPYSHKSGSGCPKCRGEFLSLRFRDDKQTFINKAKKIHGETYDYLLVNYKNQSTKVEIVCPKHGKFPQEPKSHLSGRGCPICKESKGEREIRLWLTENKINFIPQYKFNNCINPLSKRKLPFDFYLPDFNICIEYQGKQHYSIKHGGFGANKEQSKINFQKLIENDKIKKDFCSHMGIDLLTISFKENIKDILSIKFKGILKIINDGNMLIAEITNN